MKVLFITNYPSPYRVDFFNLLGKECDLTVIFSERPNEQKHRASKWFNNDYTGFKAVFLNKEIKLFGRKIFIDIIEYLNRSFDAIIIGGYSSLTNIYAINFLIHHKIPYYLEADGALLSKELYVKYLFKSYLIKNAIGVFSPSKMTDRFFLHYNQQANKLIRYPFSSLTQSEIETNRTFALNNELKQQYKNQIGYGDKKILLSVGQIIERKGIKELLDVAPYFDSCIQVIWVGGKPTTEIKEIIKRNKIKNIIFIDFCTKKELEKYYIAADLFIFPTRYDIWGLVVNEAMSYGLPVISTDRCGSALELINNKGGFIFSLDNKDLLINIVNNSVNIDLSQMSRRNLKKIKGYSIEKMVDAHLNCLINGGMQ